VAPPPLLVAADVSNPVRIPFRANSPPQGLDASLTAAAAPPKTPASSFRLFHFNETQTRSATESRTYGLGLFVSSTFTDYRNPSLGVRARPLDKYGLARLQNVHLLLFTSLLSGTGLPGYSRRFSWSGVTVGRAERTPWRRMFPLLSLSHIETPSNHRLR